MLFKKKYVDWLFFWLKRMIRNNVLYSICLPFEMPDFDAYYLRVEHDNEYSLKIRKKPNKFIIYFCRTWILSMNKNIIIFLATRKIMSKIHYSFSLNIS